MRTKECKFPLWTGHDIGESRHFFSLCYVGLTVHRGADDANTDVALINWKSKNLRFSQRGESLLRYDPLTTRYWPKTPQVHAVGDEDDADDMTPTNSGYRFGHND